MTRWLADYGTTALAAALIACFIGASACWLVIAYGERRRDRK